MQGAGARLRHPPRGRRHDLVGLRRAGHRRARTERRRQDHLDRVRRGAPAPRRRHRAGARQGPLARRRRPPRPGGRDAAGRRTAQRHAAGPAAAPPRRPVRRSRIRRRPRGPAGHRPRSPAPPSAGSPAASGSGWPSPPPSSAGPRSRSWTSPPRGWTRTPASTCGTWCARRGRPAAPSWSPPTRSRRPSASPTTSSSSTAAPSWRRGRSPRSAAPRGLEDTYFALTREGAR